jgi:hypothetical protein
LAAVTSADIAEWQAFEIIEPFGERAAFHRTGIVAAMLYNVNRGKNTKPAQPKDFMPGRQAWEEPEEDETSLVDRIRGAFRSIAGR